MRVACVGLATRDTILRVPSHPEPDGRVVADELVVAGGGPAATAGVTLARLGVETLFLGVVGDDDAGSFVLDGLAAEGVDVSHVVVAAGTRTPQSVILVGPGGERSIVHRPGDASFPRIGTDVEAGWVHADHAGFGAAHEFVLSQHKEVRLSVDGGNPIPGLDLDGVALYAPTEGRLRADFGDAGAALAAGAETVVVTRGPEGSVATTREGVVEAAGVPCEPVSTLGAGDVFHGALLAFLVRGASLADALQAANTAAALSCRALDGRSAIPTLDELERSIA
jgi:sugar/nucleoside kinase (ribokinase family)